MSAAKRQRQLLGLGCLLAGLTAGCGSRSYPLEVRWAPLREVVEAPPGFPRDRVVTLGARVHVADLARWLERYPEGSPEQEALLLHEREHALRQRAAGLGPWLARYLRDRTFMWAEEQRGWALELAHLEARGRHVDPVAVARALASYRNLSGRMVRFSEAISWVLLVLRG